MKKTLMNPLKQKAFKLRLEGKSYSQIEKDLGVSRSTQSSWFSRLVLSEDAQKKINLRKGKGTEALLKRNRLQTKIAQDRARTARKEALACIGKLSDREKMLVGAALYWAEGYKRPRHDHLGRERFSHEISLTNADPYLIESFMVYADAVLRIPVQKMKLELRLFAHQNENEVRKYWSDILKIPDSQIRVFRVKESISSLRKKPFDRLLYGVAQLRIADSANFHVLMGHIEGLKKIR